MRTINVTEFKLNLKKYFDIAQTERVIIKRSKNRAYAIVPIVQTDETVFLLSSPANARHLKMSMAEIERGEGIEIEIEDLWK